MSPAGRKCTDPDPQRAFAPAASMTYPTPSHIYRGYIFDLDGTVYLGDALLPGVGETIAALRARRLPDGFYLEQPHPHSPGLRRQAHPAGAAHACGGYPQLVAGDGGFSDEPHAGRPPVRHG